MTMPTIIQWAQEEELVTHNKKSKMESSVDIYTVNNNVNSGDNDDSNYLNNIFSNITNRSAEKLQSNPIFHSQIWNILNESHMENQPVSGYCSLKMENITDIFSSSTVCAMQKKWHETIWKCIGVVFILSIDTGDLLDYILKCLVFHECSAYSKLDKKSEKYKNWWDKHKATCYSDHCWSSDTM